MPLQKLIPTAIAAFAAIVFVANPSFALEVGDTAPCVVLQGSSADGTAVEGCIRNQENESQSFTLVEFFSISCSDCKLNLPILSELAGEIGSTTTVRGVSIDRDRVAAEAYVSARRSEDLLGFPVAFDEDRDAKRAYDVFVTPTLFLLNQDNTVLFKHSGVLTDADLSQIRSLTGNTGDTAAVPPSFPTSFLQVGDFAPCVILEGVSAAGERTEGCIRDVVNEDHQFTAIDFMSIHCNACLHNLPTVSALASELSGKLTTRAVTINQDQSEVETFVAQKRAEGLMQFPVAFDVEHDAARAYGLQATPSFLILDRNNQVVFSHVGILWESDLQAIRDLVNGN